MSTNLAHLRQYDGTQAQALMAGNENSVRQYFAARRSEIRALVPSHMDDLRVLRCAVNAMHQTPQLMQCTMDSLFGSISYCATLGLEPNTPAHHCYLVPFWNNKRGNYDVQVIPGYRGLIELATRDPRVRNIDARTVFEGEPFDYSEGYSPMLMHKPLRPSARGDVLGYYARVFFSEGGKPGVLFWYNEQVLEHRDRFGNCYYVDKKTNQRKPKLSSPWFEHPEPMGRKTVIRQLMNTLPQSPEFVKLEHLQNLNEQLIDQGMHRVLEGEPVGADSDVIEVTGDNGPENQTDTTEKAKDTEPKTRAEPENQEKKAAPQAKTETQKEPGLPVLTDLIDQGKIAQVMNQESGELLDGEAAVRELFERVKFLKKADKRFDAISALDHADLYIERITDPATQKKAKAASTKHRKALDAEKEAAAKPAPKEESDQPTVSQRSSSLEDLIRQGDLERVMGPNASGDIELLDGVDAVNFLLEQFKSDTNDRSKLAQARAYVSLRVYGDDVKNKLLSRIKVFEG